MDGASVVATTGVGAGDGGALIDVCAGTVTVPIGFTVAAAAEETSVTPVPTLAEGDPGAADGQTLMIQPLATQMLFRTVWGDRAAMRWLEEHGVELAHGRSGAPAPAAQPIVVAMTDADRFAPTPLSVPRGTTVTWQNRDTDVHTVTGDPAKSLLGVRVSLPSGAQPWDSGLVSSGQTFAYTFATPGHYVYICTLHGPAGMVGTIDVTG